MNAVAETQTVALERPQTAAEELANSISHGAGFVAAGVALPFLLARAAHSARGTAALVGAAAFLGAALILYLTSVLYHAWPHGPTKRVLRLVDHIAVFLLIAGSYTPFTFGVLRGPVGWSLSIAVWTLALAGITLKTFRGFRHERLSTILYLVMGWLAVVAIGPLWRSLPRAGFLWLVAGGLSYTVGVIFYQTDHRVRFGHFLWHLFVLAGTACHFKVVLSYAL